MEIPNRETTGNKMEFKSLKEYSQDQLLAYLYLLLSALVFILLGANILWGLL